MREIKISRGLIAQVSDEDYEYLNQYHWQAMPEKDGFYVGRKAPLPGGKQTTVRMHREIMGAGSGQVVDHINHQTLDNRRENLRLCTAQENQFNTGPKSEHSGYKGVTWHKRLKKWQSRIRKDSVLYCLGYFSNRHSAAIVYNHCAKVLFGDYAMLNDVPIEALLRAPSYREDVEK